MRLAGAVLSCLVAVSFAAAEPAKQDAAKAAPAKKETKAKAPKAEQKAAVDAIAASYTAIPLTERIAIQNDLVWTGDYNGLINGDFGERAIAASRHSRSAMAARRPASSTSRSAPRLALPPSRSRRPSAGGWCRISSPARGSGFLRS
jgi:hypothetical protein